MADSNSDSENKQLVDGQIKNPWDQFFYRLWSNPYIFNTFLTASSFMGGFLFGYDLGIISAALLQISKEFMLDCFSQELVVSILLVGACFGSVVSGPLLDFVGRRLILILNGFIFILGALTTAFSGSLAVMYIGRFLLGVSVTFAAIGECLYVSEIASQKHRGKLVSLNELGITVGMLVSYLVGHLLTPFPNGWRAMFGLASLPAVLMIIALVFLPPSPRHLMYKGHYHKSESVLKVIRTGCDHRNELANIKSSIENEKSKRYLDLVSTVGNYRLRLIIGMGLVILQQFTGQPNMLFYAPIIFRDLGFDSDSASTRATVGFGIVKVLSTILAILVVDKIGRKKLLVAGTTIMTVCMLIMGVICLIWLPDLTGKVCVDYTDASNFTQMAFSMSDDTSELLMSNLSQSTDSMLNATLPPSNQSGASYFTKILSMVTLFVFVTAYGFSFGPITWILLSEIYPPSLRGRAMSLAVMMNWICNLVVSLSFLHVMNAFGQATTFFIYGGVCIASVVFCAIMVPETKGKTLEKISREFEKGLIIRNKCICGFCLASDEETERPPTFNEALRESSVWVSVVS